MKYRNDLKKRILAGLLAGAALCLTVPAAQAATVVPNTQLPDGGHFIGGDTAGTIKPNGTQMDIHQNNQNAVIVWDKGFNVGANATVNFTAAEAYKDNFNTLNYDKSGSLSQIYGTINAQGGNIYIVNPNGVEIGNSAQINTGSLYVSNKNLDDKIYEGMDIPQDMDAFVRSGQSTDAVLMSLGNINANTVTFEGSRIVIDTERIKDENGDKKLGADKITIRTNDASNVVIGYDAYDKGNKTYAGANSTEAIATVNGQTMTKADGYMWVEDIEQLQAINTNLSGNYALRNSIDATATQDWNVNAGTGIKEGFQSLGTSAEAFNGKFDGLDYNIFNLNINRADENNVGLFGVVGDNAVINNVTLVGGTVTGGTNVGALAGSVQGGAHISNVTNSASVTGMSNVGGIAGSSDDAEFTGLINTGTIKAEKSTDASNAGGLIGSMNGSTLGGESYNLGAVSADNYNVGGLVGYAVDSVIGNEDTKDEGGNVIAEGTTVYNRLNVTGAYNVGGIVGNMEGTQVYNAENSGDVSALSHTTGNYAYHSAHYANNGIYNVSGVYLANVGGIAGSSSDGSLISGALNLGEVSSGSAEENGYTYYTAGNVGGIVGSAVDTNITNATNRENNIRGAHNVGGIAGYFSGSGTVSNGINDGGDILATGARDDRGFVKEWVRLGNAGGEEAIIGNMGGIVGYMDGDDVYVTSSANRGTVHSQDITGSTVQPVSQAANAGGIVGKIDRDKTKTMEDVKSDVTVAAVSNSYNTGDVRGYMAVGGIAGMMYNGEIAGSYNLGNITTTRNAESFGTGNYYSVNMGGIVGDTTEGTTASALLYDVYNKGQIGDETFNYYARHVGGIVGRLSGKVEKAYNAGDIYNGYNVTGGIAGWFADGSINNSFNVGNITVVNNENGLAGIQAGGIAGGASIGTSISNVYNLGTIRGFQNANTAYGYAVGGIVGAFIGDGSGTISNAYTTGNLYLNTGGNSTTNGLGSIYGSNNRYSQTISVNHGFYIKPETTGVFQDLSNTNTDVTTINYADRTDASKYEGFTFTSQNGGTVEGSGDWRIYAGNTLPILNAFLPDAEDYFDQYGDNTALNGAGISSIQYGTAYDPFLTIIHAADGTANLAFDWSALGLSDDAGLAVYGSSLTLNNFSTKGYFSGILYSDGALDLNGGENHNDILFGSAANLYGSSVDISTEGTVTSYGNIYATASDDKDTKKGNVTIEGGEVNLYGKINFSRGQETAVPGIAASEGASAITADEVRNPHFAMETVGDRYAYNPNKGDQPGDTLAGDVTITATNGDVNLYYGQEENGLITSAGNLTVNAAGNIYSDSDLAVEGNITFNAPGEKVLDITNIGIVRAEEFMDAIDKALQELGVDMNNPASVSGSEQEVRAEIQKILAVYDPQYKVDYVTEIYEALAGKNDKDVDWLADNAPLNLLHDFLHNFTGDTGHSISFRGSSDGKLTIDMWDEEQGVFDLNQYDSNYGRGDEVHTLGDELSSLNIQVETAPETVEAVTPKDYVYIWVADGNQLAGIQKYYDAHEYDEDDDGNVVGTDILSYNFALKNDIDASNVTDYVAIGTDTANGFTGTFDGRDNRIIGLNMTNSSGNAGLFDTIGDGGTVTDLRIYSSTFRGGHHAGAVAGVNHGTITDVTAFGNVVTVTGESSDSTHWSAGGIVGRNDSAVSGGTTPLIDNVTVIGTVASETKRAYVGGIAGLNHADAKIQNSISNSAVNSDEGDATALGGVVGVNAGEVVSVESLGVTVGVYYGDADDLNRYSDQTGGIAGSNSGTITNAYNESVVSGRTQIGGIVGFNTASGSVENVANASSVTGEADPDAEGDAPNVSEYVGGLAGKNTGTISNGRNSGEISGNNFVGGLVGGNAVGNNPNNVGKLTNLVNDSSASITGDNYVGGIAGSNAGIISADEDNDNLINRGTITGQQYVGGVAGVNTGTIANTNNDVDLHIKNSEEKAEFFGGVVGSNEKDGTITNATNHASVSADGASYVGGVVGKNDGVLSGMNGNYGTVSGKDFVGGVAGENTQALSGVNAVNQGDVTAKEGGAGGIFAVNSGKITDSTFTSSGAVSGTTGTGASGTGGIFGVNEADIENSTLENKGYTDEDDVFHDSIVTGTSNTGGLIGINTGDVSTSSLKNEADIKVEGDNVSNIGGLIGQNSGTITGGQDANDSGYYKYQIYNNGTITVTDSGSNIGGLIGNNAQENGKAGSLTAGYNTGAIEASGSTNVGGIAGTNAGTLDQVFNTVIAADGQNQTITGSTSVGGIAGTNTGSISNAYNTSIVTGTAADAVSGSIAGTNSNTADDSISNVYSTVGDNLVGSGNAATHVYDSENGFDEENEEGSVIDKDGTVSDAPWRQYGDNNPILKVFLTQLTVNETGNDKADGKTLDEYLNLVYNGKEQDINIQDLIDKGFITGPDGMIKKDEDGNSVSAVSDAHKNTMKNDGTPDSALLYNTGNKKDAGDYYNWIASAQIAAGNDGNPNNLGYDIDFKDNEITIGKATIKVTLEDIYRIYGNSQMYTDKDHTKTANGYDSFWSLGTTTEVAGAADDLKNVSITVTSSSDGAVNNLAPGKTTTNNVGDYNWGVTVDISNISQNYQLEGAGNTATSHSFTGEGKSHVGKADLNITAGSDTIYVGGTPHFSGTVDHFVNGDSFHIDFGLSADNADLPQIADTHNGVVGFWYDNRFYTSGTQGLQDLFGGNYNVTFKPGTLTVLALPDGMPDIPEIPGIENHWNGLLGDNPWDRNRDFRERKAEIHYIAGGMTL